MPGRFAQRGYRHGCISYGPTRRTSSPDPIGGGANLELLTRISLLEQRLAEVEKHATADTYGIVRLSDSESVTNSEGLALPASEKNAAIEGSLANQIRKVESSVGNIVFGSTVLIPSSNTITINAPGIVNGTGFAINGDTRTIDQVHVMAVATITDTLIVKLSGPANNTIRINYIYKKS